MDNEQVTKGRTCRLTMFTFNSIPLICY